MVEAVNDSPCQMDLFRYDENEYNSLDDYWSFCDNIFNSDFDFVVHAEYNGVKDNDIVYYNSQNNAILSESEYQALYNNIRRNSVCKFKKRTCEDYDKWQEENLPESLFYTSSPECDLAHSFDEAIEELGYPKGWEDYQSHGVQEYVYCWINRIEWRESEEYSDYCCPLCFFDEMTFREAKAKLILNMKANHKEDKIYSSPFADTNERIANAFEKMANALAENNRLMQAQVNQPKPRYRVNKRTGTVHYR